MQNHVSYIAPQDHIYPWLSRFYKVLWGDVSHVILGTCPPPSFLVYVEKTGEPRDEATQ